MRNATLLLIAVAGTVLIAQEPKPTFEVASVRKWTVAAGNTGAPHRNANGAFDRPRSTVASLIEFAFNLQPYQVVGGPEWVRREHFAVHARTDAATSLEQMRFMVKSLLENRFMLRWQLQHRPLPVYVLSLARPDRRLGSGLRPATDSSCKREVQRPQGVPSGALTATGCGPIGRLISTTPMLLGGPVLDKTGLTGVFEWSFYHSREGLGIERPVEPGVEIPSAEGLPSYSAALREQLGLRLDATRAPVEVLVINSVQQPTEN